MPAGKAGGLPIRLSSETHLVLACNGWEYNVLDAFHCAGGIADGSPVMEDPFYLAAGG